MRVNPARHLRSLALVSWAAACSPNAAEEAAPGNGAPIVSMGEGPMLCAEGDTCGREPGDDGDSSNVTTSGMGTVVFGGENISNGGGIRLSDKMDLLFVVDNSLTMGDKQQTRSRTFTSESSRAASAATARTPPPIPSTWSPSCRARA